LKFYKKGFVDIKAALYLALIFAIFASISADHGIPMDPDALRKVFGLFTIGAGIYIFVVKQ